MRYFMLAFILCATILNAAASGPAAAQENPLAKFVIGESDVGGFTIMREPAYYGPESLWNYINGGALPYLDYGVVNVATYSGSIGGDGFEIVVDIYDMADSLGAFGIYSNERFPEYDYLDIGVEGYLTENALSFWKDRYYIKIFSMDASPPSTGPIETVGRALDSVIPDGGGMAYQFGLFPRENRLPKTESYIAKNVLGQDYLTNAFTVRYAEGDAEYQLYILATPSAETAKENLSKYRAFLKEYGSVDDISAGVGDENFVGREDWYGLMVFARSGRFILGSVGLDDFDRARDYLAAMAAGLE